MSARPGGTGPFTSEPVVATTQHPMTTQHDLDVRYGRVVAPRRRRLQRAAGLLAVGAALGWVVWAGLGQAGADVRFNDVGYRVVDDATIEVTYDVNKDPGRTAVCTLQAFDREKATVGYLEVRVGPHDARVVRDVATVRTAAAAASAAVQSCTLLPAPGPAPTGS